MSTKNVRSAILATLQTIDGTGAFAHNLSRAGQVLGGKYSRPPGVASAPFACAYTVSVTEGGPAPLTDIDQVGIFSILAWAPASAKHPAARQDAAETLLDDIRLALRGNRRLVLDGTPTCIKFDASLTPFEDEVDQSPDKSSWGIVVVALSVQWRER